MSAFVPQHPGFEERVRTSFARQRVMTTIGGELTRVAPGEVEIRLGYREELGQQHGFLHAGIITTIVDSACGYAAFSLMPAETGVLTVEYKVNFLNPARGELFIATGRVLKAGRTLSVCMGEVVAHAGEEATPVATMLATVMTVRERRGVRD